MREIKFRAWLKKPKRMTDIMCISLAEGWIQTPGEGGWIDVWNKGKYILMQYTGLHDKNGVEIYEGDVVRCECVQAHKDQNGNKEVGFADFEYKLKEEFEIIGNIYENPELLTK